MIANIELGRHVEALEHALHGAGRTSRASQSPSASAAGPGRGEHRAASPSVFRHQRVDRVVEAQVGAARRRAHGRPQRPLIARPRAAPRRVVGGLGGGAHRDGGVTRLSRASDVVVARCAVGRSCRPQGRELDARADLLAGRLRGPRRCACRSPHRGGTSSGHALLVDQATPRRACRGCPRRSCENTSARSRRTLRLSTRRVRPPVPGSTASSGTSGS
jgi:hypothetical protein